MTLRILAIVAVLNFVPSSMAWPAAIVNYLGTVYQDFYNPFPYPNAYVIAGTFAPGFDYTQYTCVYGSDEVCNMADNGFQRAVIDGNLIPIGSGTLSDGNGMFIGSGMTFAASGTPIFLFAFGGSDSSGWIQNVAFATSTDPSFLVPPSGIANLDASLANLPILGGSPVYPGLVLSGGLPFPEPTSAALGLFYASCLLNIRRRSG